MLWDVSMFHPSSYFPGFVAGSSNKNNDSNNDNNGNGLTDASNAALTLITTATTPTGPSSEILPMVGVDHGGQEVGVASVA